MEIWQICRRALESTWHLWPILLVLWILNGMLAALGVAPAAAALEAVLNHSLAAQQLSSLGEANLLFDIGYVAREGFRGLGVVSVLCFGLMMGVNFFAVGGILGRLDAHARGGDGFTVFGGFWIDGGRFLARSFRLAAYGLLLLVFVLILWRLLTTPARWYAESSLYKSPVLWLRTLSLLLLGLMMLMLRTMVDAARADMFMEERRSMFRSMVRGISVVVRHPRVMLTSYGLTAAILFLPMGALWMARLWIPEGGWITFLLALLVTQGVVLLRIYSQAATVAVALWSLQEIETEEGRRKTITPFTGVTSLPGPDDRIDGPPAPWEAEPEEVS